MRVFWIPVLLVLGCVSAPSGVLVGDGPPTGSDLVGADDDDAIGDAVLFVNEFMADNETTLGDAQGLVSDWLELYNPGAEDLLLDGYSASDDWTEPAQHVFADGLVVPAYGHLLLWASGTPEAGGEHLSFRLSADGESVGVFDPSGSVIDWVSYPAQGADQARGRAWDGADDWEEWAGGSPGEPNG